MTVATARVRTVTYMSGGEPVTVPMSGTFLATFRVPDDPAVPYCLPIVARDPYECIRAAWKFAEQHGWTVLGATFADQPVPDATAPDGLAALALDGLPAGMSARLHCYGDDVLRRVWYRVQVYPTHLDPDTFVPFARGGLPAAMAMIEWDPETRAYRVYVSGHSSGAYVQRGGRVASFDAAGALSIAAAEVSWDIDAQRRGW